ncbi:hypothetical protein PMAYCL1PPCAC_06477, partial [Pristionchus mayeri]
VKGCCAPAGNKVKLLLVCGILSRATNFPVFFVSRIIASISSGISFGSLILFLQEATPTELRGVTSFLSESTLIMTMGLGIGFGMDAVFGTNLLVLTSIS